MSTIGILPGLLASIWAFSCSESTGPEDCVVAARDRITVEASDAATEWLTSEGYWRTSVPPRSEQASIDSAEALSQARAFVRTFGPTPQLARYLQEQRGASIDFTSTFPIARVEFAASPYSYGAENVPKDARRAVEGFFLVVLGDECGPVLSVAVSALNDDIAVTDEGRIRLPPVHANTFFVEAVPVDGATQFPVSAEAATIKAFDQAQVPVAEVPFLLSPGLGFVPNLSRWRVVLERSVEVRGISTGRRTFTSELFIDAHGRLLLPRSHQPPEDTLRYPSADRRLHELVVTVSENRPVVFEEVAVLRN